MDIKKLQEELVEKILLIPTEDDSEASGREALGIINELEDHINDIIAISDQRFTALDCVIIADSQGDNPRISERVRINNRTLKELENAIRNVGGKTSEELGLVQNIPYSQSEFQSILRVHLERIQETQREINRIMTEMEDSYRDSYRRSIGEITRGLFACTLAFGSTYLMYQSSNDEEFSTSRSIGMIGMAAFMMLKVVGSRELLRGLTIGAQERQTSMNLENATVQPNIEGRQTTLG